VNKKTGIVHNFFDNMKYMEMGGAIRRGSLAVVFFCCVLFHKQLSNFDSEISNWKSTLERNEK
jgi:hypothetical protein